MGVAAETTEFKTLRRTVSLSLAATSLAATSLAVISTVYATLERILGARVNLKYGEELCDFKRASSRR